MILPTRYSEIGKTIETVNRSVVSRGFCKKERYIGEAQGIF